MGIFKVFLGGGEGEWRERKGREGSGCRERNK